jgi:hypothetical protein
VFLITAVTFLNFGIKLAKNGTQSLTVPFKLPRRKPKVDKEIEARLKRQEDLQFNVDNYYGWGSTEREIK